MAGSTERVFGTRHEKGKERKKRWRRNLRTYGAPAGAALLFAGTATTAVLLTSSWATHSEHSGVKPPCAATAQAEPVQDGSLVKVDSPDFMGQLGGDYYGKNVTIQVSGLTSELTIATDKKPTKILEVIDPNTTDKTVDVCVFPGQLRETYDGETRLFPVYVSDGIESRLPGKIVSITGADTHLDREHGYFGPGFLIYDLETDQRAA